MERSYEKRHSKHHKEKHKKRLHKKYRIHGTHEQSYATVNSVKPLVEYSDVSSEELSAPEAGEIESEASSISRHIADDLDRTRKSHPIRTFVDNKTISVTTSSRRDDYILTHDSSSAASRKRRGLEYVEEPEFDEQRYKKKKEKRKKDKKKKKKKSRHHSRSASLESVSPDDNVPTETPARAQSPPRYEKVPVSEWEKASSPLRNGSCSPVSPSTPPLMRHEVSPRHRELSPRHRELSPRHRELSPRHRVPMLREASLHHANPFSPHRDRSPIVR
ncbi:cyclin-dependent kinase 12-like [Ostrinia furnacalis]|nr:cyclin-dependent kinase 12-like [Ostrinia furnacalis]